MITCKQVASLLSAGEAASQPLLVRMELRLHLFLCRHCSRFARQIDFLRQAVHSTKDHFEAELDTDTAANLEARLLRQIQNSERPKE